MEISRSRLKRLEMPEHNRHKLFSVCEDCRCMQFATKNKCIFCGSHNVTNLYSKAYYSALLNSILVVLLTTTVFIPVFLFSKGSLFQRIIFWIIFIILIGLVVLGEWGFFSDKVVMTLQDYCDSSNSGGDIFINSVNRMEQEYELIFYDDSNDREEDKILLERLSEQIQNLMSVFDSPDMRCWYRTIFCDSGISWDAQDYINMDIIRPLKMESFELSYYEILMKLINVAPQYLSDKEYNYMVRYSITIFNKYIFHRIINGVGSDSERAWIESYFNGIISLYYSRYYRRDKRDTFFDFFIKLDNENVKVENYASEEYAILYRMMKGS